MCESEEELTHTPSRNQITLTSSRSRLVASATCRRRSSRPWCRTSPPGFFCGSSGLQTSAWRGCSAPSCSSWVSAPTAGCGGRHALTTLWLWLQTPPGSEDEIVPATHTKMLFELATEAPGKSSGVHLVPSCTLR
jgi:hypothetical protein